MGQYYKIINLTKREYLHPHKFGDGLKLLEFGSSGSGTMLGLAVLLANSNGRGGGDLHSEASIIGSWAGDSIVIAGDYAELGDKGEPLEEPSLYHRCEEDAAGWKDISYKVMDAIAGDNYCGLRLAEGFHLDTPQEGWMADKLPKALKAKLKKAIPKGREVKPLHVRLAEAVLHAPEDVTLWRPLVDCLLESVIAQADSNPKGE